MTDNLKYQVMAFAGICQAVRLVQQVANTGECDQESLSNVLNAILITDPKEPIEVFGSLQNLALGYTVLIKQLVTSMHSRDTEVIRYLLNLIALESKLRRRQDLLDAITDSIQLVYQQTASKNEIITNSHTVQLFAEIYSKIISPLGPKLQISGKTDQLRNVLVQHKIRALLLAGIRACVLWRQLGGKRYQFIINRARIINQAHQALNKK